MELRIAPPREGIHDNPIYFFVGVLGDDRFEDFGELTSSFG